MRLIQWTTDEIAKMKCAVDSIKNPVACGYGKQGGWAIPRVSDGQHTVYLIANDRFGNTPSTVSRNWLVGKSLEF